jgi:hypothetical protein
VTFNFGLRIWLIIAAVVVAIVFLVAGPSACTSFFSAKKEARVAKGQAGASIDAGAEAINTVSAVEDQRLQTEATVKEAIDEIRSAPKGNSNDAALRAACRMRQYRDLERCARLRAADPAKPAGADAAR